MVSDFRRLCVDTGVSSSVDASAKKKKKKKGKATGVMLWTHSYKHLFALLTNLCSKTTKNAEWS